MRPSSFLVLVLLGGCSALPSSSTQVPAGISSGALYSAPGSAEAVARSYLAERATTPGRSFRLFTTRQGLAGTYLRFQQYEALGAQSLRVWDGEVVVLVRGQEVRAVNSALRDEAAQAAPVDAVTQAAAAAQARALLGVDAKTFEQVLHVDAQGTARVAWLVTAVADAPPHAWSLLLDAVTLRELERRDGVKHATGQGYVFDMNAVASSGDLTLTDNNNATSQPLDAQRFLMDLPRLDGSGPLRGDFADARTRQASSRAQSATLQYLYDRSQLGFEQTVVYFHVTRAQERLQRLGFTNVNNRVQVAIVDAQTDDNSFYTPTDESLNFGTGGVDDAEDADIVLHEYGHSIQDNQVPGFGGNDESSMGEGFGDYLSSSMADVLATDAGHPQLTSAACVGEWDSTAYADPDSTGLYCLRRVDGTKHYPEAETGEVHDDGEMWSAALWHLRGALGPDAMDSLVLESHFLLTSSASFFTAAQAVITADANVNAGANEALLRRGFIQYGLLRTLSTPADGGVAGSLAISVDPVRSGPQGNYTSNADESQTLTVPGAEGLRVHFTRVDLETSNQCLSNSCDNLYVLNGQGDLFQVVSGAATNGLTTVAVPGDTLVLRFVSDSSSNRFGFHADRLDVLGEMPDGGFEFDAGVPVVDAGFDAGTPAADAGFDAGFDAGIPWPTGDAGVRDAGVTDAGTPQSDAGTGRVTLFLPTLDHEELSPVGTRGCGCGAGGAGELFAALSLLSLLRRRRR